MVDTTQKSPTDRTAFSSLDKGVAEFNVAPAVLASKITDGGTYIVIARGMQGQEPKLWSTGDTTQAQALFEQYQRQTA